MAFLFSIIIVGMLLAVVVLLSWAVDIIFNENRDRKFNKGGKVDE